MIKLENTEVFGWEAAIRGMRNPMNSWQLSDSYWTHIEDAETLETANFQYFVGENDLALMKKLSAAGSDHGKFLRMINVTVDITAPLYWWKEADTYAVGKVQNSCSTMHKIHAKKFELSDFSCEHLFDSSLCGLEEIIKRLNFWRSCFIEQSNSETRREDCVSAKECWWQMIQLLPTSYNQLRTVQLNYAVLKNMYHARKNHKLDEWHSFCDWALALPYFEEVCVNDRP